MKGDLFCIRTNKGYGLFQEFDTYIKVYGTFYCVYYTQIDSLSRIEEALRGKYYYQRINLDEFGGHHTRDLYKQRLLDNKGKELSLEKMCNENKYNVNTPFYNNCYMTYLGNYSLPIDAEIPRYVRMLYMNFFAGKYSWDICDEAENKLIHNEKGKIAFYKKLTEEIKNYPEHSRIYPANLLLRFNIDYRIEDGDLWAERQIEKFYEEHPEYRPSDKKYDDIKYPLPTDEFRSISEQYDSEYAEFCDRIEKALLKFIASIDANRKAVRKPLISLVKEINMIDKEMQLMGSLEADDIYVYIVEVLRSLKKVRLIDTLEEYREW